MLKVQLEERHSNHEELLRSMKSIEKSKEEIQEANKILSFSMEKSDQIAVKAKEKLEEYKIYKKIFDSSSQIECVHCEETISANGFKTHLKKCPPPKDHPNSQTLLPLSMKISGFSVLQDENDNYEF